LELSSDGIDVDSDCPGGRRLVVCPPSTTWWTSAAGRGRSQPPRTMWWRPMLELAEVNEKTPSTTSAPPGDGGRIRPRGPATVRRAPYGVEIDEELAERAREAIKAAGWPTGRSCGGAPGSRRTCPGPTVVTLYLKPLVPRPAPAAIERLPPSSASGFPHVQHAGGQAGRKMTSISPDEEGPPPLPNVVAPIQWRLSERNGEMAKAFSRSRFGESGPSPGDPCRRLVVGRDWRAGVAGETPTC